MNDLELALASLFKKKGKSEMTEKEFVFSASMDFRWFTPKEAQKFLDIALDSELAKSNDGQISLSFNHKDVKIPKGYKPSAELLKTAPKPKGLFLEIVDSISKEKGKPVKDIIARINRKQEKMKVYAEVAALLVGYELEADVSEFIKKVEKEIAGKE